MAHNEVELAYRLPITTVTVDGMRTIVTNPYTKPKKVVTYASQIVTQIESDPSALCILRLPEPNDSTTSCAIEVAADGRLTSTQAGVDDKSQDKLRTLLKAGLTVAGTVAPIAAAALLAPAALPTAAAMALAGVGLPLLHGGSLTHPLLAFGSGSGVHLRMSDALDLGDIEGQTDEEREALVRVKRLPSLKQLGIEDDYRKFNRDAATLLANLRWSHIQVQTAIASAGYRYIDGPDELASRLKSLEKARKAMATDLAMAEADYAKWIASSATTDVDAFHRAYRLQDLPSSAELLEIASGGDPDNRPPWWSMLVQLQCAVSCDLQGPDLEATNAPLALGLTNDPERVTYRIPRLATIKHWTARPTSGDSPLDPSTRWELTEVLRERNKVVVMQGSESSIPLRPMRERALRKDKPSGDSDTGISFDADGILTKLTTKRTDPSLERAATLAELPGDVAAGISASKALLKPFTVEGQTGRLNAQTALIKAQKDLKKAQTPSPDDPPTDLKASVEEAELNARRARAEAIVSDPTRSLVQITVTPTVDAEGRES